MWNEVKNALFTLLALYLCSCLIAFAIATGILIFPLAVAFIFCLAIKEMALWARKPVKAFVAQKANVFRQLPPIKTGSHSLVGLKERVGDRVQKWSYYFQHDKFTFNH